MDSKHVSKMVGPIIIMVWTVVYMLGWLILAVVLSFFMTPLFLIGIIIPFIISGIMIFVTRQRIKEIRSGEEDDLSKY